MVSQLSPMAAGITWGLAALLLLGSIASGAILTMGVALVFLAAIVLTFSGE